MRNSRTITVPGAMLSALLLLTPASPDSRVVRQVEPFQDGEQLTLHSGVLGEDRTVLVRLPEAYAQSGERYPVLYVLDGEYFFQQAAAAVQFLSELGYEGGQHPIPDMIVVGVVNVDRDRDYTPTHAPEQARGQLSFPTSGGAAEFRAFLEDELIPLVDSRYRTQPLRVLSGWSLGGLFTVHTYLEAPRLFARYLAISPSLWWDDSVVVKETRRRLRSAEPLSPDRLVLTLGALEGGDMNGAVRRNFVPLLTSQHRKALDFTFVEIPGENHNYVPYKAYYEGLTSLNGDWIVPGDVLRDGLAAVSGFFEKLSEQWGYRVAIPVSVYRTLSVTLPDTRSALAAAEAGVEHYPHSSVAHLFLGRLQQMNGGTAAAVASLERALQLQLERPVPQSEWLRAIRGRLQSLQVQGGGR